MSGKKLDHLLSYETMMKGDSNYKVTIGGLFGGTISGVLNAPMPIAGANEFESAKSALSKIPMVGKVFDATNSVADVVRISGNDMVLSLEQTRKVWQESRTPALSIEMTFWNIDSNVPANEKPINKVRRIYSALFPTRRDEYLVQAPLGYKFTNEKGDAVGTLNLRIGQWFRAGNLVMTDANFTPSLEVTSDGTPLYFTGTVTFEPFRMITYEEYLSWFRVGKPRPPHNSTDPVVPQGNDLDNFVAGIKKETNDFLGQFKKLS